MTSSTDYIELKYDRDLLHATGVYSNNRYIYLPFSNYGNGTTIEWSNGTETYKEGSLANDFSRDANTTIYSSSFSIGSTITVKVYGDVKTFFGHSSPNTTSYLNNRIAWSNTALKSVKIVGMSSITNCQNAFSNATNLESVDLTEFDSSNVTDMSYMFYNCSSIKTMNLTGSFDVSKVTNFSGTFYNCSSLTDLNITTWQTNSATTFNSMFRNCSSLEHIAPTVVTS